MVLLQTIVSFIVAIALLIVVHELGHYSVARLCGVKVLRFSVGMGKIIFSRRFGPDQTEWAISVFPLGGYVKLLDAREQGKDNILAHEWTREFTSQNVWRRIAIVAAGPIANFLLAIGVYAALFQYGIPEPIAKLRFVAEQSAAYHAGLRGGEIITAIDGQPVQSWADMRWHLLKLTLKQSSFQVEVQYPDRRKKTLTFPANLLAPSDLEGDFLGKLGLALARPPASIGTVFPDGPAMKGGLQTGDLILQVDGKAMMDGLAFIQLVRASPGKLLELSVQRGPTTLDLSISPETHIEKGQKVGKIQAEIPLTPEIGVLQYPPLQALGKGIEKTWDISVLSIKLIGRMIVGDVSWKNVTGPITIADYAGQSARIGVISYLSFIAFISISLGVMNLLPIPVLDGGLLLYYSLEVLTGRPISERAGEIAQRAGLAILMTLMVLALFNDIVRLAS